MHSRACVRALTRRLADAWQLAAWTAAGALFYFAIYRPQEAKRTAPTKARVRIDPNPLRKRDDAVER